MPPDNGKQVVQVPCGQVRTDDVISGPVAAVAATAVARAIIAIPTVPAATTSEAISSVPATFAVANYIAGTVDIVPIVATAPMNAAMIMIVALVVVSVITRRVPGRTAGAMRIATVATWGVAGISIVAAQGVSIGISVTHNQ